MKTILRVLALGIFMTALTAVGATSIFAQDPCADVEAQQALYKTFTDNYSGKTVAQKRAAIEAGNQYIEKYGACETGKEIVDYLKTNVPKLKEKADAQEAREKTDKLYTGFDTALKNKNTGEIFSNGKQILAQDPNLVDVLLVLASVGYDQAVANPPVDTYNNEAVNYAKTAIQKLESNTESKTGDYGVLQYSYKTKEFPDGKANALGWMNYTVGYINYYRLNKKEEALPYLYKATQVNSGTKTNAFLYQTIGSYYRDQVARLGKDIVAKIEAVKKLEAAGESDTDAIKALVKETNDLIALQKGYADRAIDAYARAYKMADPKDPQYRDGLYATLKEIYNLRYEGKRSDVDAFVANVNNTPLPDPTTKVTPVVEAEQPTGTNTTTSSAGTTSSTTNTTPGTTKPATTTSKPATAKPATNGDKATTTKPMSSTTPSKSAAPVKKATTAKKNSK